MTQPGHTPECLMREAERKFQYDNWMAQWPASCDGCQGYGGAYGSMDRDTGLVDFTTCEQCWDKNICPRCFTPEAFGPHPQLDSSDRCLFCGWNAKNPDGAPPLMEDCGCYEDDLNQEVDWENLPNDGND